MVGVPGKTGAAILHLCETQHRIGTLPLFYPPGKSGFFSTILNSRLVTNTQETTGKDCPWRGKFLPLQQLEQVTGWRKQWRRRVWRRWDGYGAGC